MNFPHILLRTAAVATMGIAMWAVSHGVAQADPADPQMHESDEPRLECPKCTPEVQQLLAQLGPVPEPGPVPADWPAPFEVNVPVGVGPPGLPLPPLPGVGLPQLPAPQDLPPPPAPPQLPPLPPPPGLPPPPWPF